MSSCLVICDDVLISTAQNKHLLHGVVDVVSVPQVPIRIGPFAAYIRLSNVYRDQEIQLTICTAVTEEPVFSCSAISPESSDPLQSHTIILQIPPFEIRETGRYIFSASHGGVPFAQSPIQINFPDHGEPS